MSDKKDYISGSLCKFCMTLNLFKLLHAMGGSIISAASHESIYNEKVFGNWNFSKDLQPTIFKKDNST